MGTTALTLAELSAAAYTETPVQTLSSVLGVTGFKAVNFETLGTTNGVFHNENAAAAVTKGVVDGENSLILSFRGTDDPFDWQNDFLDINTDYAKFTKLFGAVDYYAKAHDLDIVVTGHSLGGSLVQNYMAQHPDTVDVSYEGVSFGSPGANIPASSDQRVTDYILADDAIALAGLHRQDIANALRADPTGTLETVVGDRLQSSGLPLTDEQLHQAAEAALQQGNYHNIGTPVVLNPTHTIDEVSTILTGDLSGLLDAHDIRNYIAILQADLTIPDPGTEQPVPTPAPPPTAPTESYADTAASTVTQQWETMGSLIEDTASLIRSSLTNFSFDFA